MNLLTRRDRDWPVHLAVLLGMAALAALLAWPMVRHLSGHLPSWYFDNWNDCWSLWWMREALWVHPHNPFVSPIVEYPLGAEMYWHNLEPAKTVWGVVLVPLVGVVAAHNLLIWTTFPLAGYTAWLFVRYLLEREGVARPVASAGAFAGACVFTFSRYHLCHAEAHLNLSAIEGLPLYLFFFVRFLDAGRKRDLLGLALAALYTALCDYYYLAYATVFSALWVVAEASRHGGLVRWGSWRMPLLRRAAVSGLAAAMALAPLLALLLAHAFPTPLSPNHGDADYGADLAGYFVPDRLSAWLSYLPRSWRELSLHLPGNNEENGYFLGYLTPLLGLLAARRSFLRDGWRWLAFALVFVVLSLGVELSVGGSRDVAIWQLLGLSFLGLTLMPRTWRFHGWRDVSAALVVATVLTYSLPVTANGSPFFAHVTLPFAVFKAVVPFFGRAGMADRFVVGATLALAVVFAAFAARVASRFKNPRVAVAVGIALAVVPCLEYSGRPMTMEVVAPEPAVFDAIRQEPPGVAVFTDASTLSQFEQIDHGHPISYARLARVPVRQDDFERANRLYQALLYSKTVTEPVSSRERDAMRGFLREHRFRYYIAHWFDPARDRFVTRELGGRMLYRSGDTFVVYVFDDVT